MRKVIVLGSINMDLSIECDRFPLPGETIHGHHMTINLGGKGANQAVASAKMGTNPFLIGAVGKDAYGELAQRSLMTHLVNVDYLQINEFEPTGIALITRSQGENQIILSGGANQSLTSHYVTQTLEKIVSQGDIFLTQFENDYQVVIEAIKKAKALNMMTVFNPAPAQLFDEDLYQFIDLLIVNQTEAEILSKINVDTIEQAKLSMQILQSKGVKDVIITLGKEGSIAIINEEVYITPALKVKTVDSTAAGDAFIGTICHGFASNMIVSDILMMASTVSAMTVMKIGAIDAIPTIEAYQDFIKNN